MTVKKIDKELYESFHKKSNFQKKVISENNYTYFFINKNLKSLLSNQKKLKILDYGCGVGTLSTYLAKMGHNVYGVDISKKSIDVARVNARNGHLDKNCTFDILDPDTFFKHKQKSFDLICCIEVIEHLSEDVEILKKIAVLLNKNGTLILSTRSKNSLIYKLGLINNFEKRVGHLRRYSDKSIVEVIEKSGLKIEKIQLVDSVVRDFLYNIPLFGFLVKFIIGPFRFFMITIENPLIKIFGNSGYIVLAKKA
jgi:ubiquinone biosynthesis O-methyltransferase